jgi:hypothetical protein
MRLFAFTLTIAIILISCNSKPSVPQTSAKPDHNSALIKSLQELKQAFASGNTEKIAEAFTFPVADTAMSLVINDSTYTIGHGWGESLTKAAFIKYFSQTPQFEGLSELFKHIHIDSLNQKDTLETEIRKKEDPCYKTYHIDIDGNELNLEFRTNSNDQYVDPSPKKAEADEDEGTGDECEYAEMWIFHFDGTKLHFVRQAAAG